MHVTSPIIFCLRGPARAESICMYERHFNQCAFAGAWGSQSKQGIERCSRSQSYLGTSGLRMSRFHACRSESLLKSKSGPSYSHFSKQNVPTSSSHPCTLNTWPLNTNHSSAEKIPLGAVFPTKLCQHMEACSIAAAHTCPPLLHADTHMWTQLLRKLCAGHIQKLTQYLASFKWFYTFKGFGSPSHAWVWPREQLQKNRSTQQWTWVVSECLR